MIYEDLGSRDELVIKCGSKSEYIALQRVLFKKGYFWPDGYHKIYIPHYHYKIDWSKGITVTIYSNGRMQFSRFRDVHDVLALEFMYGKDRNELKLYIDDMFKDIELVV